MLVKSKLDYGCEAHSSASKSVLESLEPIHSAAIRIATGAFKLVVESLEPIHNAAIRIATGAFKSSPIVSINSYSGLKPLKYYREIKILNHLSRIYVKNNHPLHEIIISWIDEAEKFAILRPSAGFFDRARQLQQQYNVYYAFAMIEKSLQVLPWRIPLVKYCEHLFDLKKNT